MLKLYNYICSWLTLLFVLAQKDILGMFFDRIFRPEEFVFALDPKIPGNAYIDMEGNVHEELPKMEQPPPEPSSSKL